MENVGDLKYVTDKQLKKYVSIRYFILYKHIIFINDLNISILFILLII